MILNDILNRYSNFDNVVVVVVVPAAAAVVVAGADDDDGDSDGDVEEDFHRDNINAYRLYVGADR